MDDFAVARTRFAADRGAGIDDDDLAAGTCQTAGDGETDNPGTDDKIIKHR